MADLLWPGDERAGSVFTDSTVLDAMVAVEQAWLRGLAETGIAPAPTADVTLAEVIGPDDVRRLAEGAEAGGNPVVSLVTLLRERTDCPWVHRGLTSQDVLDTALVLCLREAADRVLDELALQARTLRELARTHRGTTMAGRTLTQHAVPVTFGLKAATWLAGLCDGGEALLRERDALQIQIGGAAGTLAAVVQLGGRLEDPVAAAVGAARTAAETLGLRPGAPWHTRRSPVISAADALNDLAGAWGHIGGDIAVLSRPEIAELREGSAGGSSTMPGKANPVLAILLRRHAIAAPGLASTLHTAAGAYVDERPDGAWHAEWDTLRLLARRSVVAAAQATALLSGLVVNADRMRTRAEEAAEVLTGEQGTMGGEPGSPDAYLGISDVIIDDVMERAAGLWNL